MCTALMGTFIVLSIGILIAHSMDAFRSDGPGAATTNQRNPRRGRGGKRRSQWVFDRMRQISGSVRKRLLSKKRHQ